MLSLIKKIVGTKNEREVRRIQPLVEQANALEPQYREFTDAPDRFIKVGQGFLGEKVESAVRIER